MPSEYFRSNLYATFWFENNRNKLPDLIEAVGEDRILFETDFPHPTCLYPDPLETVEAKMATLMPGPDEDHGRERQKALPDLSSPPQRPAWESRNWGIQELPNPGTTAPPSGRPSIRAGRGTGRAVRPGRSGRS